MGMWTKANKTTRTPSVYITYDTETRADSIPGRKNRVIHRFKLGHAKSFRWDQGCMTRRKQLDFTDPAYFWNWVISHLSKERPVVAYAHNAAFDLTVLKVWELIESGTFRVRRFVNTDPPFILRVEHERGRLDLLDSLNWFQCSLAQIGQDMGVPKGEIDFTTADDTELMAYCRQDVAILEKRIFTLINWIRDNDLGVMQRTAPSQAMQAAKHRFLPRTEIKREDVADDGRIRAVKTQACYPRLHQCVNLSVLERDAYFGGQATLFRAVEIYDPGSLRHVAYTAGKRQKAYVMEGPIYHLDVNSLYPYVMREYKYPGLFLQRIDNPSVTALQHYAFKHEIIAHVRLNTPTETFPTRYSDSVVYAIGTYWTSLCGNELRYALSRGYVADVAHCLLYEPIDLFSRYVDYFYPMKVQCIKEGNKSELALVKMMLNSLQAKWGAKSFRWIDVPGVCPAKPWGIWPEPDLETGETIWCRGIGSHKQRKGDDGDAKDSFISIPASVCANGRDFMRDIRRHSGNGNTLYQHTDSVHVTQEGYNNLRQAGHIHDNQLGKLRLVEVIREGEYRGVNDYDANGRTVQAGLNWSKVKLVDGKPCIDRFERSAGVIASKPMDGICVSTERIVPYHHNYEGRIDYRGVVHPVKLGG